jgi:hypothetical protein
VREICSPGSQASHQARRRIELSLAEAAEYLSAKPRAPWIDTFYQLANRLAHLYFLRTNGVDAYLLLVNFIGDQAMNGPRSAEEWQAGYRVVRHVMGIPVRNPLEDFVIHIHPSVADLNAGS